MCGNGVGILVNCANALSVEVAINPGKKNVLCFSGHTTPHVIATGTTVSVWCEQRNNGKEAGMPPFFMNLCKVQGFFCRHSRRVMVVLGAKFFKPTWV